MTTTTIDPSDTIDSLFAREQWKTAQKLIEKEIKSIPSHDPILHWWYSRLSTAFYEQRKYSDALDWARRALRIDRECPLAWWEYAGALDMLGQEAKAIRAYQAIIRLGKAKRASADCWEGKEYKRSLLADCKYRMAKCYDAIGKKAEAAKYRDLYHKDLAKGINSIYSSASDVPVAPFAKNGHFAMRDGKRN